MPAGGKRLSVPFLDRLTTRITIAAVIFLFALTAAVTFRVESGFRRSQFDAYRSSREQIAAQMEAELMRLAEARAQVVTARLQSTASAVQAAAAFAGRIPPGRERAALQDAIDQLAARNDSLAGLYVLFPTGETIRSLQGVPLPPAGLDWDAVSQFFSAETPPSPPALSWHSLPPESAADSPTLLAAAPVVVDGRLAGAVAAMLSNERLAESLAGLPQEPGGRLFVVDGGGELIYAAPGETQPAADILTAAARLPVGAPAVQPIQPGGEAALLAAVPLGIADWRLAVLAPQAAIDARAEQAANPVWHTAERTIRSTLAVVFVFFLIGLLAAFLALDRLFNQRITGLIRGVQAVASGDYDVSVPDSAPDELGLLGRSFNRMAAELRRRQAELQASEEKYRLLAGSLESQVEENTRQIRTLYDQAAARSQELEVLYHADEQLLSHLKLDAVLQALAEVVVDRLEADKTSVMIWDDRLQRLVIRGARGFSPAAIERLNRYAPGDGVAGLVFQTGQILAIEDAAAAPPPANRIAAEEGIRSLLSVPILSDERIIGVFGMNYSRRRSFTPADIRLCQSLAQRAAIAIRNARLYEQAELAATLEERQRLARELHDSITQSLYSLALLAEAGRRHTAAGNLAQAEHHLVRLGETAQQALKEMRLLVYELRPLDLAHVGFVEAVRRRLEAVEKRAGVQGRVSVEGDAALPPEIEDQLYRITLEALNNSLKHSQARSVTVTLRRLPQIVEFEIRDDGGGFDPQASGGGIGLASMEERAARIGGRLSIESTPGQGAVVRVRVELPGLQTLSGQGPVDLSADQKVGVEPALPAPSQAPRL